MKCIVCKFYKYNIKDGGSAHCQNPNPKWSTADAIWKNDEYLIGCKYGEKV